jgi:deoxyribodipyrimidine photo-lyase
MPNPLSKPSITVLWIQQCLRIEDNPAIDAALSNGIPILPIFCLSDLNQDKIWSLGGASKWWLHQSLKHLQESYQHLGSSLLLFSGDFEDTLKQLQEDFEVKAVVTDERWEPSARQKMSSLKAALSSSGIPFHTLNTHLCFHPDALSTQQETPFKVFTPFWKKALDVGVTPNLAAPSKQQEPLKHQLLKQKEMSALASSVSLDALNLLPSIPWDHGFYPEWTPGEKGAKQALDRFILEALENYHTDRDRPDKTGTSRLSAHLHFGEISPLRVWHELNALAPVVFKGNSPSTHYLREIAWREFAHHLLVHFPHTPLQPLRPEFEQFPWQENNSHLKAWQKGLTGYPIVDAGMRELWATGWMHNRVRMIVASFLVKHLLLPWQEGAHWFWDTLVDADLPNNTLGWQWSAGCGADAAPYFRIFNPILQGIKFDPDGVYIRRWIPELSELDTRYIHTPWETPPGFLTLANIKLGEDYPYPIVDHQEARQKAIKAFETLKGLKVQI